MTDRGSQKPSPEGIFNWETLQVIGPHDLPYEDAIPGSILEVDLITGSRIRVFRADDRVSYFCHGLTFGGKDAPGGAVSPFSDGGVQTILGELYVAIEEANATIGDILVWKGGDGRPIHSAILTNAVPPGARQLDYATVLRSKNGINPEADVTLLWLITDPKGYGESYQVYRRK